MCSRLFKSSIIALAVGPRLEAYQIHESILCADSPYLKRRIFEALKDEDTHTKTIKLPGVDSTLFEEVLGWMYDRTFDTCSTIATVDDLRRFVKLYKLANQLEIERLQNEVGDLIKKSIAVNNTSLFILEIAPEGVLRDLVADQLAWDIEEKDLMSDEKEAQVTQQLLSGGWEISLAVMKSIARLTKQRKEMNVSIKTCYTRRGALADTYAAFLYANGPDAPIDKPNCTYHKHVHTTPCS